MACRATAQPRLSSVRGQRRAVEAPEAWRRRGHRAAPGHTRLASPAAGSEHQDDHNDRGRNSRSAAGISRQLLS